MERYHVKLQTDTARVGRELLSECSSSFEQLNPRRISRNQVLRPRCVSTTIDTVSFSLLLDLFLQFKYLVTTEIES
jgi:hypothetical protein